MKSIYAISYSKSEETLEGLLAFFRNLETRLFILGTHRLPHLEELIDSPSHERGKIDEIFVADLDGLDDDELKHIDLLVERNNVSWSIAIIDDQDKCPSSFSTSMSRENFSFNGLWEKVKAWGKIKINSRAQFGFVPYEAISIVDFVKGNKCKLDVFSKSSLFGYRKEIEADKNYEISKINFLLSKDITELYIGRKNLEQLSKTGEELIVCESSDEKQYLRHILSVEIASKISGINRALFSKARADVDKAMRDVRKNENTAKKIKKLMTNPFSIDLGINLLLAHVSFIVCDINKWSGGPIREKLLLASLFHDCSLAKFPKMIELDKQEDQSKIDGKPAPKFWADHPIKSFELIKDLAIDYPGLEAMIKMHHERPDGSGIPLGLSATAITKEALLFIVAMEMTNLIVRSKYKKEVIRIDFPRVMEKLKSQGMNKSIESLERLFNNPKN